MRATVPDILVPPDKCSVPSGALPDLVLDTGPQKILQTEHSIMIVTSHATDTFIWEFPLLTWLQNMDNGTAERYYVRMNACTEQHYHSRSFRKGSTAPSELAPQMVTAQS